MPQEETNATSLGQTFRHDPAAAALAHLGQVRYRDLSSQRYQAGYVSHPPCFGIMLNGAVPAATRHFLMAALLGHHMQQHDAQVVNVVRGIGSCPYWREDLAWARAFLRERAHSAQDWRAQALRRYFPGTG